MKNNQTVSIIIACYNAERYVEECIASLLAQTYRDIEVLIVDDASIDSSLDVITLFADLDDRVRVFSNDTNVGAAEARNLAISHSSGRFIAICDADDVWEEDKLELQMQLFSEKVVAVSCDIKLIDSEGQTLKVRKYPKFTNRCYQGFLPFPAHSSIVVDRRKLNADLHYDANFTPAEDYFLLLKLSFRHHIQNLQLPKVKYRIHGNNISDKKYQTLGQVGLSIIANVLRQREHDKRPSDFSWDLLTSLVRKNAFETRYQNYVEFKQSLKKFHLKNMTIENLFSVLIYVFLRREPRKRFAETLDLQLSEHE